MDLIRHVKDDWWVCEQASAFADDNFELWSAVVEEGLTRVATAVPLKKTQQHVTVSTTPLRGIPYHPICAIMVSTG